jgi:hypothetical protein
VLPDATDALTGDTAIETRVAGVTLSAAVPVIKPEMAVIVVVPGATLVASPCELAELLIVATPKDDELHCTVVVIS